MRDEFIDMYIHHITPETEKKRFQMTIQGALKTPELPVIAETAEISSEALSAALKSSGHYPGVVEQISTPDVASIWPIRK